MTKYTQADYDFLTTGSSILSIAGRAKEIFDSSEIEDLKVFPNRLKNTFWDSIDDFDNKEDLFMGVN